MTIGFVFGEGGTAAAKLKAWESESREGKRYSDFVSDFLTDTIENLKATSMEDIDAQTATEMAALWATIREELEMHAALESTYAMIEMKTESLKTLEKNIGVAKKALKRKFASTKRKLIVEEKNNSDAEKGLNDERSDYQKKIKKVTDDIFQMEKEKSSESEEVKVLVASKDKLVSEFKAYEKDYKIFKEESENSIQELRDRNLKAKQDSWIKVEVEDVNKSLRGSLESCKKAINLSKSGLIRRIKRLNGNGSVGVVDYGDVSVINFICVNGTLFKGLRVTFDPKELEFVPTFNKLVSVLAGKTINLGAGMLCHLRIDESGDATFSVANGNLN